MSKSNKNWKMPRIKFLLRAILLLSCYFILEAEGGHNFKFVKQSVKQSSWLVDTTMKNTMSDAHCAAVCVTSLKCSAFVFENGDCRMGSSSNTKPANGEGPVVEIFANPMSFKIMVVGGVTKSGLTNTVEIVDMETPETKCIPFPSFSIGTAAPKGFLGVNKEPVFCGGYQNNALWVSDCFSYAMDSGTWSTYPSLNRRRGWMGFSCNPFTDSLFCVIIGGAGYNWDISGYSAEYFNGTTWMNVVSTMSAKVSFLCSAFFNETMILSTGGGVGTTVYQNTFFFNINTLTFSPGPPLLNARMGHSCGRIYKGKDSSEYTVIIAGGLTVASTPQVFTDVVEVFDYQQNTWRLGNSLPDKITYAIIVEDPMGGVILLGGESPTSILQTIYRLANADPSTKWKLMTQKLATARSNLAAFIVPDIYTNCSLT